MQGKKRILIIEDDADFRNLLRIHLSRAGYVLDAAEDGVEGGKALLEQPPDLILSDLGMPFLGGFELLELIRADEQTASIPVVLLSGRSDDATVTKAMNLGAADFLVKPVTVERLLDAIRTALASTDSKASVT